MSSVVRALNLCLLVIVIVWCAVTSCASSDDVEVRVVEVEKEPTEVLQQPSLISMGFKAASNSSQLVEDAECEIIGDSVVECWVGNIMRDKLLTPEMVFTGNAIYVDDQKVVSGKTVLDFSKPLKMTVANDYLRKDYTVYVHSFTGLPVLWMETVDREEITSKDEYLRAAFCLQEDVVTRGGGDVFMDSVSVKGRGNSTWQMPKKPYRLKFDKKVSLLDEPKDKSWVLIANYADKTMLRFQTACYMGRISCLDYTPKFHFVELILNGAYMGTYLLGDKLKIGANRVDVGDDGFLLEIDSKAAADEITFKTPHVGPPVNIKDPDVTIGDDNYNYVKSYVTMAENALYSDNFTDENDGWQKYIDMDSFVDWYLINEIAKNNDAVFWTSCYMNLRRGGKLKMGPLWDFDIAFGNVTFNDNFVSSGFWVSTATWYTRLFQDPAFVRRVKERFNYFYSRREDIMRDINENAQYLRYSVEENNNRWGTLYTYTWQNYNVWGSYLNEVQYMKGWLNERFEWLRTEFDGMEV